VQVGNIQWQYHNGPLRKKVTVQVWGSTVACTFVRYAVLFGKHTEKFRPSGNASDLLSRSAWVKSRPEHSLPSLRYRGFPRSVRVCILESTSEQGMTASFHYLS
jgi:hypothetical protein